MLQVHVRHKPKYSALFDVPESKYESDEDPFSPASVNKLLERLEEKPLPHFSPKEHASLLGLIQTTLEVRLLVLLTAELELISNVNITRFRNNAVR